MAFSIIYWNSEGISIQLYTPMSAIFRVLSSHGTSIFFRILFETILGVSFSESCGSGLHERICGWCSLAIAKLCSWEVWNAWPCTVGEEEVASPGSTPSDKPRLKTPQVSPQSHHFVDNLHISEGKKTSIMSNLEDEIDQNLRLP